MASGQNVRLQVEVEKVTESVTLVSTPHSPRQFASHARLDTKGLEQLRVERLQ